MKPNEILQLLESSYSHFQLGDYYRTKWAPSNKVEAKALDDYFAKGGTVPIARTEFGKGLLNEIRAHHELKSALAMGSLIWVPPGPVIASNVATRPTPPSAYSLPGTYTAVSTSAALITALQSGTPTNIVVEDGVYTKGTTGEVDLGASHKVYARNLLGAEIQFGVASNKTGNTFQGLAIHCTDAAKTLNGYVIHLWGGGTTQVLDCTFLGNDSIGAGLAIRSTASLEGLVIRRCEVRDYHDYGFLVDANSTTYDPTTPPILEDIYTENCVWQTNPQGSNGVSEAGVWLGCRATLNRLWCHQVPGYTTANPRGTWKAWQGLWIGTNVRNMTINDLLTTGYLGFGVYGYGPLNSDDVSTITVNRFECHSPISVGWHQEWNNPGAAHHPNTQKVIVQDSYIESDCVGYHLDQGTVESTVRRTKFKGQASAALVNYSQGTPNNLYDTTGNDYSEIGAGAVILHTSSNAGGFACWNT